MWCSNQIYGISFDLRERNPTKSHFPLLLRFCCQASYFQSITCLIHIKSKCKDSFRIQIALLIHFPLAENNFLSDFYSYWIWEEKRMMQILDAGSQNITNKLKYRSWLWHSQCSLSSKWHKILMRSHHTVDPSHCCTTMTLPGEVEHCFGNLSRLSSLSFLWNSLAMVSMGLSRISSSSIVSLLRYPKWGVHHNMECPARKK